MKSAAIMEDGKTAYVLLGIENQTDVHYAMPVRNMLYDALQYNKQIVEISANHHRQKDYSEYNSTHRTAEFLSGFHKNDKLLPVITLVLFFNSGEWDGPRSLLEMMEISDPTVQKYIQNYQLNLINPKEISDNDLEKFHSSLREVLGCIKYSKDKNKPANFIYNNPRMNMELEAARVIETITRITIDQEVDNMGNVNMCKAIEDMVQDVVDEKKDDWLAEGISEGRFQLLSTLIQSGKITTEEAAVIMNMTPEEFLTKIKPFS